MLTLIRNADVHAPEPLGLKDILIAADRIAVVADPGSLQLAGVPLEEVDARGSILIPGLIDPHVHILGGGGEGGPATRAPEINLETIVNSGVTGLIGCLGTDGVTRHMTSLLAKARGLEIEGITTFIFSGSYEIPVKTLTGSVRSDLINIDKVVGAGEIALSDHRSSQPTFEQFSQLAAECRVGGMLGGKAGILHVHLGGGERKLDYLFRLIEETEIPATQVVPTHANRNPALLEQALRYVLKGGFIDLTADLDPAPAEPGHLSIAECIRTARKHGAPLDRITISSDSNGSLPVFDGKGRLTGLTVASQKSLLANFRYLIEQKIVTLEEAVRLFSTTAAACYRFDRLGGIRAGLQADMLLLDGDLRLTHVFARGRCLMAEGRLLVHGTFRT
jgi:beta-aspartyl-dipeptidase (metallo-type)